MRRPAALLVVVLSAFPVGCATSQSASKPAPPPPAQPAPPKEPVKLEPIKVVAKTDTPDALSVYDAETLFNRGIEFLDGRQYVEARQYFQKLLDEFPDSSYVNAAHYNLGVALMESGDPTSALPHFDAFLANAKTDQDRRDATFKRGACLAMLGRYQEVVDTFDTMLGEELETEDRIEALVDSGIGWFMLGDRATAEYRFAEAVKLRKAAEQDARLENDYHHAQALFYLAEILRLEFTEYKLKMPANGNEKEMADQLEEKCQRLLRAQYAFLKVIRTGHAGWASAAGFKVGSLYEDLHDEMVNLPVPPDMDAEQADIYRRELRKKVAVLVRKAMGIYESTVNMARRTGADNVWVTRTEQSLERMKQLLKDVDDMEREDGQAS
ncbi:MAG: tetratricopeptide repeat protein [Myxococcota bacterium]